MIFGVSFDTVEENRTFSEKFDFNYPLLCDTDRQMGLAYGACDDAGAGSAKRIGVVIDTEGKVKAYEPAANASAYPRQVLDML